MGLPQMGEMDSMSVASLFVQLVIFAIQCLRNVRPAPLSEDALVPDLANSLLIHQERYLP
jgi:hypothetical protein